MATPVSRLRTARNFNKRRSNVRRNWSRVVHLIIVAVTVGTIITAFVVLSVWVWPKLMTQTAEAINGEGIAETPVVTVEKSQRNTPSGTAEILTIATIPEFTATAHPTLVQEATVSAPLVTSMVVTSAPVPILPPTPVPAILCTVLPGAGNTMIYLRSAPYLALDEFRNLGMLERGVQPRILSKYYGADGLFFKVLTPDGVVGWVPATLCIAQADVFGILVPIERSSQVPTREPTVTPQLGNIIQAPTQNWIGDSLSHGLLEPSVSISCSSGDERTWFEGYLWINGRPANGYRVWFMSRYGGDSWSQLTGPHEGYWNWPDGYYAHIVDDPRRSDIKHLRVWVTDPDGRQISTDVRWDTECSYARIDFRMP